MTYLEALEKYPLIYNTCSTYQLMMDQYGFQKHPQLDAATWILRPAWRERLKEVLREYLDVGEKYKVPVTHCISSRSGYRDNVARVPEYLGHNLMQENMDFFREIVSDYSIPVFVGCIEASVGDQYKADGSMSVERAYEIHRRHMEEWLEIKPDYMYSGIMPEIKETIGIAKAFSDSKLPYNIGFIVTDNGRLLDGTTLHDAISMVDDATENPAAMFMCNCIHPENLFRALKHPFNKTELVRSRLKGTISNASMLKPSDLEINEHIINDSPAKLVDAMIRLYDYNPMRLVGGCCGTDEKYMEEIVRRMQEHVSGIRKYE